MAEGTVTCDGCGTTGATERRQEVGRTNPVNPKTGRRWWSRRVQRPGQESRIEHACSPECRVKVEATA